MAGRNYGPGWNQVVEQTIDITADTLKLMLVDDTYVMDPDQVFINDGTADDPASHEITATNYVPGFAGAGRKTVTVTRQYNSTNHRIEIAIPDQTWSALGGAVNATVAGIILYWHDTDDGTSRPLTYFSCTPTVTNGGDLIFDFLTLAAGGNIRHTV